MKHSYFSRRLLSVFMAFALGLSVLLAKDFVVVIDAGHGGHDPGSLGSKAKEKNINLGVALKLGRLIENNMQGVKVVYTRKKDVYLTLQERANIANKVQGDLFISIHTNSLDKKSPNRRKVAGASTWTLGLHRSKENLEVAKRKIPLYIWRMTFRLVMKDSIRIRPSRILFLNSCSINTWSRV